MDVLILPQAGLNQPPVHGVYCLKERAGFSKVSRNGRTYMAGHLQKTGNDLSVFNRTKKKAEGLLEKGVQWYDSPAEAAANADVVFTKLN